MARALIFECRILALDEPTTSLTDAESRIMGEEANRRLGGKGKIAIITSVGATNLERRLEGVREVLANRPLRRDHLRGQPPLSRPRRLDLGRRLARVPAQRARRRGPREDEVHLLRHDSPRVDAYVETWKKLEAGQ